LTLRDLSGTLGLLVSSFVNIYLVSKWKILVKGRFFWLRSLGASAAGELCLSIIGFSIAFYGKIPYLNIVKLIFAAWLFKSAFTLVGIAPASFIANFLKKFEGIDVFDYTTNFNPFVLKEENG
jgi:uncharacterized PurR-regulated membrane protein YhhQ (DUF165 family)